MSTTPSHNLDEDEPMAYIDHFGNLKVAERYFELCYKAAISVEPHILEQRKRWHQLRETQNEHEPPDCVEDIGVILKPIEDALVAEEKPRLKSDMANIKIFPSICNYDAQLDFLKNAKPRTYPVLQSRVQKEREAYRQYHDFFREQSPGPTARKVDTVRKENAPQRDWLVRQEHE